VVCVSPLIGFCRDGQVHRSAPPDAGAKAGRWRWARRGLVCGDILIAFANCLFPPVPLH